MVIKNAAAQAQFVCYECCVAPLLQQLVTRHGSRTTCSLCGAADVSCIDVEKDEFLLAVKALIRYHFGEWQYHSKLGDGTLESLFFIDPNPILKVNPAQDPAEREDVVLSLHYDVNDRMPQIEIFTAYGRDIYNYMPKTPVSGGESEILDGARQALRERNHFLVEAEYINAIRPAVSYVSRTLVARTRWHRARLGATTRAANFREIGGRRVTSINHTQTKRLALPLLEVAAPDAQTAQGCRTVGDADNLALFYPAAAAWIPRSSRVIDVKKVRYDLVDRQLFDDAAEYDIDYDERRRFFQMSHS